MLYIFYENIFLFYPERNITAVSDKTFVHHDEMYNSTYASPHTYTHTHTHTFCETISDAGGRADEANQNILREA